MQNLTKKQLFLVEFSKTVSRGTHSYLSFYDSISVIEEFEMLFKKAVENYGNKHFGIYRMCDAEYMYCVGRKTPFNLPFVKKLRYWFKTLLVKYDILKQRTGHVNALNKETWFGEHYSSVEKKNQELKFISDIKEIATDGFLAPHFVYSPAHFAEEYIDPMLKYFSQNNIKLTPGNYFPFYFVYVMLTLDRYKKSLLKDKNVLIITSFNERNKKENFLHNLKIEGTDNVYFYNISHDKAMLEIIDIHKLPENVDLVLIGAGIGSANIINQIKHLNALCVDAGHALDCFSRPQLRKERIFLLAD